MTKKSLSYLIETELQKAEVIIAAKSVTEKLQQMAENLAKMDANDVMPLGDAMREVFGGDSAEGFEQKVSETLRSLIEQIRNARNEISDSIEALESGEPMNDLNTMDADDMFACEEGEEAGNEAGPDMGDMGDMGGDEMAAPEGDMGGDENADLDDLFSDEEEQSSPAGRARKESFMDRRAVLEGKVVRRFAGLLREGASPSDAIATLAGETRRSEQQVAKMILRARGA